MARRLISTTIISSAKFLKMPPSTQNLYFHLIMNADDDGITEGFSVMRLVGANEDDLKILVSKGFIVVLNEDLVTYVIDWLEHNKIRADRKVDSIYLPLLLQVLPDVEVRKSLKKLVSPPDDSQTSDGGLSKVGISKGKLREVNTSKENIRKDNQSPSKEADKVNLKNSFESIWKQYPKKQGKDNSFKAYQKAIKEGISDEQIIKGIEDYKKQIEMQRTEIQFVKNGSTFFNQRCYLDEFITTPNKKGHQVQQAEEIPPEWAKEYASAGEFTVSDDDLLDLPF